jgi:MFS transporter, MHS family, proline/betaine transporter
VRKSIAAGAIGVLVHWFDWAVYAYLSTTLATVFFPAENPTVGLLSVFAVFAVAFVFRPLGALFFGPLGDKIGRRQTLALVIIIMGIATLAVGLLPSYASVGILAPILLVIARVVQGFAAGGEFGGAAAFLAEYSPRRHRAFGVSWLESSSILGFLAASLAVFLLNSALTEEAVISWGWRIPFLIAGPMAVIGLYIRLRIEDTPNFRALEQAHEVAQAPLREVLRQDWKQLLQMTGIEMLQHVSFYMILVYLLTYQTVEMNLSSASASLSATITSVVAMVCVPLFGVLSDRVGRKPLLMASGLGFVLLSFPAFVLMRGGEFVTVIVVQAWHSAGTHPKYACRHYGRDFPYPRASSRPLDRISNCRSDLRRNRAIPYDVPDLRNRKPPRASLLPYARGRSRFRHYSHAERNCGASLTAKGTCYPRTRDQRGSDCGPAV